jgi:hypothetical protein
MMFVDFVGDDEMTVLSCDFLNFFIYAVYFLIKKIYK